MKANEFIDQVLRCAEADFNVSGARIRADEHPQIGGARIGRDRNDSGANLRRQRLGEGCGGPIPGGRLLTGVQIGGAGPGDEQLQVVHGLTRDHVENPALAVEHAVPAVDALVGDRRLALANLDARPVREVGGDAGVLDPRDPLQGALGRVGVDAQDVGPFELVDDGIERGPPLYTRPSTRTVVISNSPEPSTAKAATRSAGRRDDRDPLQSASADGPPDRDAPFADARLHPGGRRGDVDRHEVDVARVLVDEHRRATVAVCIAFDIAGRPRRTRRREGRRRRCGRWNPLAGRVTGPADRGRPPARSG